MITFDYSLETLKSIINDDTNFSKALKNCFTAHQISQEDSKLVSILVGCELRHYYVFNECINSNIKGLTQDSYLAVALALANDLFLRRVEASVALDFVKKILKEQNQENLLPEIEKFIQRKIDGEPLIDESIDKFSYRFMSYRFNIPEWVAKMWSNHFSKNIAYKIAKANSKSPINYLRLNPNNASEEDVFKKPDNGFEKTDKEGLYIYTGKEQLKKNHTYFTGGLFNESLGYYQLVDAMELDALKDVAIISTYYNPLLTEIAIRLNGTANVEQIVEPGNDFFEFKSASKKYNLKKVQVLDCNMDALVTAISKPTSTIVVTPNSSRFDLIRYNPDFFLHFKQDSLDEIIAKEKMMINEAGKFVEDKGRLVYAVSTINRKETREVVNDFLRKNPDFYLKEEKQFLPYDASNSCLYYAILVKAEVKHD